MLTLLGVLLIIASIVVFVWNRFRKSVEESNMKIANSNERFKQDLRVVPFKIPGRWWVYSVLAVLLFCMNGAFFYADAGTAYAVQYPWGGDKLIKTQGLKLKWWGRTIPLSYEISVKDIILNGEETLPESERGIYNREAKYWEFSDAIKAKIGASIVVTINTDDEQAFLNMADKNRSEGKLLSGRVLANIDAALRNTAKLMDAQEYISGKASEFDRFFRDQLNNGTYIVEEYYPEISTPEVIGDTTTVRTVSVDKSRQKKYRIKRDKNGSPLRDNASNSLSQYGINFVQAQITNIDWEASFDKRLQLQKEQVAQTQLEKQEAEKEFYRAKKEKAKGESEKAKERARLEKEQIQQTIAAETKAKVATQDVIAERKVLEVAKLKAQSQKVLADAQAYENQRLVSAGLTPQERAELELEKAKVVSEAFSKMSAPNTVIMGSGNGGNATNALIQATMAKQLMSQQ